MTYRQNYGIYNGTSEVPRPIGCLVADAVTGRLDVRAAAAALPQDELPSASAPDALDESETDGGETTTRTR
jgi:hypothetical protein